jgi:superfamily II DNA/RNA helicase
LHRSGRTARAGKTGRVVTLATHQEQRAVNGITLRAGVEPWVMAMTPMDEKLVKITGAREPSGIPLEEELSAAAPQKKPSRPRRNNGQSNYGREQRSGRPKRSGSFDRNRSSRRARSK